MVPTETIVIRTDIPTIQAAINAALPDPVGLSPASKGTYDESRKLLFGSGGRWHVIRQPTSAVVRTASHTEVQLMTTIHASSRRCAGRGLSRSFSLGSRCVVLAAATLISGQFATSQGVATYFNRNITAEANMRIKNFAAAGHKIICVAFPVAGGNRYSIVTDETFYNPNVPAEMHSKMLSYWKAGHFQALYATATFPLAVSNIAPIKFQ